MNFLPKSITAADGKRVKIYFIKESDGSGVCLNYEMLKRQKCTSDEIRLILELAKDKYELYKEMYTAALQNDSRKLKLLAKKVTKIEYALQRLWHFKRDKKFHRFWEMPGCKCPKMYNAEVWPTKYYITNDNCPIHGHQYTGGLK
jgi:hypothetical protein